MDPHHRQPDVPVACDKLRVMAVGVGNCNVAFDSSFGCNCLLLLISLCTVRTPVVTSLIMLTAKVNGTLGPAANGTASLRSLSTEGGETVVINGTNFGPALPRSYISAVWYGTGSAPTYSLTNCTFTIAQSQLQCPTVPGIGTGYRLQVHAIAPLSLLPGRPASSSLLPCHHSFWFPVFVHSLMRSWNVWTLLLRLVVSLRLTHATPAHFFA